MIKSEAIGIECDEKEKHFFSNTLVNFKYNSDKENDNVCFLVQAMNYALDNSWNDLFSANILFNDGYLYLIDYVPGRGKHKIGDLGIGCITEEQRVDLKNQKFDIILEKALKRSPKDKVSYDGLNLLRKVNS
jgi:tRNA A-37 threonylcarbamoyl transferase component Bud32